MGTTPPEEHAGRSAELQRLLNEIGDPPAPVRRRPPPRAASSTHPVRPGGDGRRPADGSTIPLPRTAVDARGTTPPEPTTRSPLRSSPPTTFPRRVRPAAAPAANGAPASNAPSLAASADPSARQRRSGLVRSPINRAEVRSSGAGRSARVPPASTKTAAARSMAGRWGPAGYPIAVPEQRVLPATPAATPEVSRGPRTGSTPPAGPSVAVAVAAAAGQQRATSTVPPTRPTQRRALILAGGVAAAVVAIVAIVSIGNRSGSGPATDAGQTPQKVATVQTTGADGRATVATVTAPVSTVNGQLVALVQGADGQVRQLPVVTAAPPAVPARTSAPAARTSPARTSAPVAAPTARSSESASGSGPAAATAPANGAPATTTRSATQQPTTTAPPSTVGVTNAAPDEPGDVATVVTGLTTLTGWEPVTTN